MEEMKNGMNASNENQVRKEQNEENYAAGITAENGNAEMSSSFTEQTASAAADELRAEQAEPAPVDYSIGAGARESIRRAPTMAYNTADNMYANADSNAGANADAGMGAAASVGGYTVNAENSGAETAAGGTGTVPPIPPEGGAAGAAFGGEPERPVKQKKPRKPLSDKAKKIIAGVLVVCLSAGVGFGGGAVAVKCLSPASSGGTQTIKIDSSDAESLNAASAIAKKVMPSVVGISTVSQTYTQTIFGLQQGTQQGVGTGIIVSSDGYILTNSHVVNDGESESITVDLYDGSEYTGTVLWNSTDLDLAIVKIDAKDLTAAEIGDSDKVEIGDYAVAIGNPLGLDFERSVTQGIISGLDRTITTTDSSTGSQNTMEGLIQTDASINSGNSGGPLINSKGQVIGINSAKASSAEGLGFSIPINTATPIIDEIKENGTYEQAYIGISGMNVEAVKAQYQTDFKADKGIYIMQIYTNSPASKAGLQEGDIITAVNGTSVDDMSALKKELVKYRPGDTIKVTYERDKQNSTAEVTLAAQSESNQQSLQPSASSSQNSNGNSGSGDGNSGSNGSSGSGINPYDFFGNYLN